MSSSKDDGLRELLALGGIVLAAAAIDGIAYWRRKRQQSKADDTRERRTESAEERDKRWRERRLRDALDHICGGCGHPRDSIECTCDYYDGFP